MRILDTTRRAVVKLAKAVTGPPPLSGFICGECERMRRSLASGSKSGCAPSVQPPKCSSRPRARPRAGLVSTMTY